MPNVLREAIVTIRTKRRANIAAVILGIAGVALLFYADWKVGVALFLIGYANRLYTP